MKHQLGFSLKPPFRGRIDGSIANDASADCERFGNLHAAPKPAETTQHA